MYVLPSHRRRGHFGALYAHVRGEAAAAGAAGLRLYADDSNSKAHKVVSMWRCVSGAAWVYVPAAWWLQEAYQ